MCARVWLPEIVIQSNREGRERKAEREKERESERDGPDAFLLVRLLTSLGDLAQPFTNRFQCGAAEIDCARFECVSRTSTIPASFSLFSFFFCATLVFKRVECNTSDFPFVTTRS